MTDVSAAMNMLRLNIECTALPTVRAELQVAPQFPNHNDRSFLDSVCSGLVALALDVGVSDLIYEGLETPLIEQLAQLVPTRVDVYEEHEVPVAGLVSRLRGRRSRRADIEHLSTVLFAVSRHDAFRTILLEHALMTELQAGRLDHYENAISVIACLSDKIVGGILANIEDGVACNILRATVGSPRRRAFVNEALMEDFVSRLHGEGLHSVRYTMSPETAAESRNLSFRSGGKRVRVWKQWLFAVSQDREREVEAARHGT